MPWFRIAQGSRAPTWFPALAWKLLHLISLASPGRRLFWMICHGRGILADRWALARTDHGYSGYLTHAPDGAKQKKWLPSHRNDNRDKVMRCKHAERHNCHGEIDRLFTASSSSGTLYGTGRHLMQHNAIHETGIANASTPEKRRHYFT